MFCKNCGSDVEEGNFCSECGNKFVTKKTRVLSYLIALAVILFSIFMGINGDKQFLGISVNIIFITK
jgi:hypothetical protein